MKKVTLLASVLTLATAVPATAFPAKVQSPCPSVHAHNALVKKTIRYYVGGHGGDFHALPIKKQNLGKLGQMRACWKHTYPDAYRVERRVWKRSKVTWTQYHHLDAITRCGEWVVCGVVENESATSGYYLAYNGGGCGGTSCYGAYQIAGSWWHNQCARFFAYWQQAWAQHKCANIVLHDQGLGAWAGDNPWIP